MLLTTSLYPNMKLMTESQQPHDGVPNCESFIKYKLSTHVQHSYISYRFLNNYLCVKYMHTRDRSTTHALDDFFSIIFFVYQGAQMSGTLAIGYIYIYIHNVSVNAIC